MKKLFALLLCCSILVSSAAADEVLPPFIDVSGVDVDVNVNFNFPIDKVLEDYYQFINQSAENANQFINDVGEDAYNNINEIRDWANHLWKYLFFIDSTEPDEPDEPTTDSLFINPLISVTNFSNGGFKIGNNTGWSNTYGSYSYRRLNSGFDTVFGAYEGGIIWSTTSSNNQYNYDFYDTRVMDASLSVISGGSLKNIQDGGYWMQYAGNTIGGTIKFTLGKDANLEFNNINTVRVNGSIVDYNTFEFKEGMEVLCEFSKTTVYQQYPFTLNSAYERYVYYDISVGVAEIPIEEVFPPTPPNFIPPTNNSSPIATDIYNRCVNYYNDMRQYYYTDNNNNDYHDKPEPYINPIHVLDDHDDNHITILEFPLWFYNELFQILKRNYSDLWVIHIPEVELANVDLFQDKTYRLDAKDYFGQDAWYIIRMIIGTLLGIAIIFAMFRDVLGGSEKDVY